MIAGQYWGDRLKPNTYIWFSLCNFIFSCFCGSWLTSLLTIVPLLFSNAVSEVCRCYEKLHSDCLQLISIPYVKRACMSLLYCICVAINYIATFPPRNIFRDLLFFSQWLLLFSTALSMHTRKLLASGCYGNNCGW